MTKSSKELLEQLLELDPSKLEKLLELANSLETKKEKHKPQSIKGRKSKTNATSQQINTKRKPEDNQFLKMKFNRQEQAQFKKDRELDKILGKGWERIANERTPNLADVTCRICGKKETVNLNLVPPEPSRYKCNSCTR